MITLHWLYGLAGAMFAAFALLSALDTANRRRFGNAAFWGLMALSLLAGDVIGNFGGARLSDFLQMVGADPAARFVEVSCLDDYYSSYDIESCLHPQTLLCWEMYGQALTAEHGAPLRLHMPVKLGYKSAKYIYSIRVTNVLGKEKGFWEDQGYSWYGGI